MLALLICCSPRPLLPSGRLFSSKRSSQRSCSYRRHLAEASSSVSPSGVGNAADPYSFPRTCDVADVGSQANGPLFLWRFLIEFEVTWKSENQNWTELGKNIIYMKEINVRCNTCIYESSYVPHPCLSQERWWNVYIYSVLIYNLRLKKRLMDVDKMSQLLPRLWK